MAAVLVVSGLIFSAGSTLAQTLGTSGTIEGTVVDVSGAVVVDAAVEIRNSVSGYMRSTETNTSGEFVFSNVPLNSYHLLLSHEGFHPAVAAVDVRSGFPVRLQIALQLATVATNINVTTQPTALLETTPVAHTDVDQSLIAKLVIESPSIGLSQVVTNATPGVVADADGAFHPLGEHADTTISVDGQPISDQQTRIFSNQIPMGAVQSMEVISGAPPAQYGDMTSMIINATMKSGLGLHKPRGSVTSQYGSFGSWSEDLTLGVGGSKWGNFVAFNVGGSGRFLDSPEFAPVHDKGNNEGIFERVDFQPGTKDTLHLDLFAARSWFQVPNTYDQLRTGQDQHSQIKSINISPEWTHLFSSTTLIAIQPFLRITQVQYYPSANAFADLPVTVGQDRRLAHTGFTSELTYSRGVHTAKVGMELLVSPLTENFSLGITDPTFNPPCNDPTEAPPCSVPETNPGFLPGLAEFDLSRGGGRFEFHDRATIKEVGLYAQDSLTLGQWRVDAGVREDIYRGLSAASAVEPRVGIAYAVKPSNTVIRLGYARLFDTPYYENLLLSSFAGAGGLASSAFGGFGQKPLVPGRRNEFNAGLQQAIGRHVVVDAGYFWKYTHNDLDFDVLFNSPITFPFQWRKSKIDGALVRVNLTNLHGVTAFSVLGHVRSRFFGPEVGGLIFSSPLNNSVFRPDHDQAFQQTTNAQYQFPGRGPWMGFSWQYESGEVAGSVPDLASALALDGDQQAAIGFFCGSSVATVTNPITACSLPYPQWGATRVVIPAPGTENDDTHPPRIAPRNLFDLGVGLDDLFHTEHPRVRLKLTAINLTNKVALYNFLSTFSGTHFVTPRSWQAELGFIF
jgi:hypothetical protein